MKIRQEFPIANGGVITLAAVLLALAGGLWNQLRIGVAQSGFGKSNRVIIERQAEGACQIGRTGPQFGQAAQASATTRRWVASIVDGSKAAAQILRQSCSRFTAATEDQ
jgi:hypothetical protein